IKYRHSEVVKAQIALMWNRGAFGNVIVAAEDQRRAVAAGAREIRMPENISGPVHARTFAIPDADHTVVFRLSEHVKDLAAKYRSGREIFVHARREVDAVFVKKRLDASQRQI